MCIISLAAALGTSIATSIGIGVTQGTVAGTAVAGTVAAGTAGAIGAGAAVGIGAGALGLGALAIGGTLAGGIVGTVAGVQQAEAQKRYAQYQANLAEENARLELRHAENVELAGDQKRAALWREMQQRQGAGRAGYASQGVVLGGGTTAEYEADIANAYDLDLKNLNYDIASESWKSKVQGTGYLNQANLYRAQAQGYGAQKGATLLGGAIQTMGNTLSTAFTVGSELRSFMKPAKQGV